MKLALRLGVCLLALAMVFLLPVALEARGYFDPPHDRAAYEARLALARERLAPARTLFSRSNPKVRENLDRSLRHVERDYPEAFRAHRDEIEAIHSAWIEGTGDFFASANAHWFAQHFHADDIRAYFDGARWWGPSNLRRFFVMMMHRAELKEIEKRAEMVMLCRLSQDVIPALAELGAGPGSALDDLGPTCQQASEQGFLDPARPFH